MNLCCFIRLKSLKSCFETYCDGRGKESGNSKHSGDLTSNIIHCLPSKWMLGNSQCPQSLLPWPYLVDQRYSPHPNHRNGTVLLMCSNSLNPHKLYVRQVLLTSTCYRRGNRHPEVRQSAQGTRQVHPHTQTEHLLRTMESQVLTGGPRGKGNSRSERWRQQDGGEKFLREGPQTHPALTAAIMLRNKGPLFQLFMSCFPVLLASMSLDNCAPLSGLVLSLPEPEIARLTGECPFWHCLHSAWHYREWPCFFPYKRAPRGKGPGFTHAWMQPSRLLEGAQSPLCEIKLRLPDDARMDACFCL